MALYFKIFQEQKNLGEEAFGEHAQLVTHSLLRHAIPE